MLKETVRKLLVLLYDVIVMEFARAMTREYLLWRLARIKKYTPWAYSAIASIEEILADSSFPVYEIKRLDELKD